MLLTATLTEDVALAAAAVGVVGLGVALAVSLRLGRLRRAYAALAGDADSGDVIAAVARHAAEVAGLRAEVERLRQDIGGIRTDVSDAVRHVAVVRYDAFGDMGGRMSFSAALLDDAGDGMVLTSINGRSETRSYAKGIKGRRGEHDLSPEEQQAVDFALRGTTEHVRR